MRGFFMGRREYAIGLPGVRFPVRTTASKIIGRFLSVRPLLFFYFFPQGQGFLGRGGVGVGAENVRVAAVQFFIQIIYYIIYGKLAFFRRNLAMD